ncbi:MAG: hydrogenase, partial [Sulfurovaceae bacterium]
MAEARDESIKKLFDAKSAKVDTNKGEEYFSDLYESCKVRIGELKDMPIAGRGVDLRKALEDDGFERRDFLKWASA